MVMGINNEMLVLGAAGLAAFFIFTDEGKQIISDTR